MVAKRDHGETQIRLLQDARVGMTSLLETRAAVATSPIKCRTTDPHLIVHADDGTVWRLTLTRKEAQ